MNQESSRIVESKQEKVLDSISPSKVYLPSIIGLVVVFYLLQRQINFQEILDIPWRAASYGWLLIAIVVYMGRHVLYSWRLRLLSEGDFSWMKSIELVTILEFASSVSPTNFGGSAVAFFLLIQENISGARATAIVIYTIIADTLFFVLTLPLLFVLFGKSFFVPATEIGTQWGGLAVTLFVSWLIMCGYGLMLLYGLFIQPVYLKRLFRWFGRRKILQKSKDRIDMAADEIELSSRHIKDLPGYFHGAIAGITLGAWILRFFTVTAILLALNPDMPQQMYDHLVLLGRGEALYAVTAYSPTPGGSGVAEIVFGEFYKEYVSPGVAVVGAVIWRVITYYPYLILGVIIIPNWIRKLINKRRTTQTEA